jgi:hypothetical protein
VLAHSGFVIRHSCFVIARHRPRGVETSAPDGGVNSLRCSRGRWSDNAVHFSFKPKKGFFDTTKSGVINEQLDSLFPPT